MKLNFTENEKKSILTIINEYESVSKIMDDLQKQSKEIDDKVGECSKKLDELSNRENKLIGDLREKYGKFSLQDISDTLYGK